ncbi:anthranilate phosphoribosyltransferase [bacterium]|nr:anthranilate phosphoribosyltransferase [bacterium]
MNRTKDAISLMVQGLFPSVAQLRLAFDDILEPDAPPAIVASFLTALRMSGERAETLSAALEAVLARMVPFGDPESIGPVRLDTCGTGGDHASSLNVSTASAIVCAAAGVPVIKHGNRAATGKSGSSQVLEALGVRLDLSPPALQEAARRFGFAFLFAPAFHPALKSLAPVRAALPFRTVFNLIGPLANPARPTHQLLGVPDAALADLFAQVLRISGVQRSVIVTGQDGLDEVTLGAPTRALLVTPEGVEEHLWHPELTFRLPMHEPREIRVESPEESARRIRAVFAGKAEHPADEAYIVANAAAGLWVTEKVPTPGDGVQAARQAIASGKAAETLESYAAFSRAGQG